jgi:hypothetical protein
MLAFVSCIAFVFQSLELAILLTATLGIHELGHVFAVSRFGIDWQVGFGIVGAWTSTPTDRRIALSHFANAVIHLSGPLFNLLYALLSVGIHWILGLNNDYWLRAANLSATIGLLNVLPIGRTSDGGKVIERIFSSLDEKCGTVAASGAGPVAVLAPVSGRGRPIRLDCHNALCHNWPMVRRRYAARKCARRQHRGHFVPGDD